MLLAAKYGSVTNDVVILFITMLALVAQLFVAGILIACLVRAVVPSTRSSLDSLTLRFAPLAIPLAFAVAFSAMAGSLYFSLVIKWTPCNLCWYQRCAVYPSAVILGIATFLRRRSVVPYALGLSIVCLPISIYHYLVEWFPQLENSVCDLNISCSGVYLRQLGYLSIPLMAATCAFTVITLLLLVVRAERLTARSADAAN